jgi:hypothetical protein
MPSFGSPTFTDEERLTLAGEYHQRAKRVEKLLERLGCEDVYTDEASTGSLYVVGYVPVNVGDNHFRLDIKVRVSNHGAGFSHHDVDVTDLRKDASLIRQRLAFIRSNPVDVLREQADSIGGNECDEGAREFACTMLEELGPDLDE